jgi:TonB family protein
MSTSFTAPQGTRPSFPSPQGAPSPSFPAPAAAQPSFPAPHGTSPHAFPAPAPGAPPAFPATPRGTQPSFPAPHAAAPPSHSPPAPDAPPHFPAQAPAARPPSFSNPGFPIPDAPLPEPGSAAPHPAPAGHAPKMAIGGTTPPTPVTALPFEAVSRLKPVAKAAAAEPAQPKSKVGFYVGILVAAGLVFAAIAVVLEARMERANATALAQSEALAHHVLEQQLKDAAKAAKEETERRDRELAAAVEAAKKQAEEDTRRRIMEEQEAERLAKLPGSIVVATSPAGASVSIDGAAPLRTPAKADGVSPGSHKIQISLAGFEPVQMDVEVNGSKVADLGVIKLQTIYGVLELSSSPDGLEFAVRAAADPAGKPVRTGRTPATIDEMGHGDYIVTFSRPGCRDHTAKVSVAKGSKSRAETKYVDGSLELTSEPSGASVNKDGSFLGTTPLVIHDLTPKVASFDLTLPGYDSTPVSCEIPEGQTLKFSAHLLRKDRVFTASEVKTPPESFVAPAPVLSASQRKTGGEVVLSLVVRRDGSVADVEIVRSSDDDIARRCKQTVERWLFRAATAPDDRTVDARIELPFKFPASTP